MRIFIYIFLIILLTGCNSVNQPIQSISDKKNSSIEKNKLINETTKKEENKLVESKIENTQVLPENSTKQSDIESAKHITEDNKNIQVNVVPGNFISNPTTQSGNNTQTQTTVNNEASTSPAIGPSSQITDNTKTAVTQDKPEPPIQSINYPVPEDAKTGIIDITFIDKSKIRYYADKNIFISKTNQDITNFNNLVKKYNSKVYGLDMSSVASEEQTEIKFEIENKTLELKNGYEIPNELSLYSLDVKDINVKEFVEQIRKENFILSANFYTGVMSIKRLYSRGELFLTYIK